jgi:hypothetical protein
MRRAALAIAGLLLGASCEDAFSQCLKTCGPRGVAEYSYPGPTGCDGRANPGVCRCGVALPDGGR